MSAGASGGGRVGGIGAGVGGMERDMLIRNIDEVRTAPVDMPGVQGVTMAMMVGRADGAPNFSMRQFRVEAGGHTPRHSHDYEHEVFVIAGRGTLFLDGEERPIRAGDALYVPANKEHQFRASEADESGAGGLRFLCFVPASRDCGEPTPGS